MLRVLLSLCLLLAVSPLSAKDAQAKRGKHSTTETAKAFRHANETLAHLKVQSGVLYCTEHCFDSEVAAHLGAKAHYLNLSLVSKREISWRVYQLSDQSFTYTYPEVGDWMVYQVALPSKLKRPGLVFKSSGHTHFTDEVHFSTQDWAISTQLENRGKGMTLYLANNNCDLRRLTPKAARRAQRPSKFNHKKLSNFYIKGELLASGPMSGRLCA